MKEDNNLGVLRIAASLKTPEVIVKESTGEVSLIGNSRPENGIGFYKEVIEAVCKMKASTCQTITASIKIGYFNSQSSKSLYQMFNCLADAAKSGKDVRVTWTYDGHDENVEEFVDLLNYELDLIVQLAVE
ncbi:DUF1987 domain-containing protein [bacterium]|jgi:hypothetical protein|nr:DUF1987 domain-containing protein [bacterium]MDC1221082.1 DUF1987 domain-containing protein [Salibacteraceae bacterium]